MAIKRKLGILDVKQALLDKRFRDLFPELRDGIEKFLKDPGCTCNRKLYDEFFKYPEKLQEYFPSYDVVPLQKQIDDLGKNEWTVINCSIHELEEKLRKLPPGRKQIAVARYQDQVTVVVCDLGLAF